MQVRAYTKNIRITPRKLRLVADSVREMPIEKALLTLPLIKKRASGIVLKTLKSAISNATNNSKLDRNTLFIKSLEVKESAFLKRMMEGARGRVRPYKKRTSHLEIVLDQKIEKAEVIEPKAKKIEKEVKEIKK